jgi:hypothetical protein
VYVCLFIFFFIQDTQSEADFELGRKNRVCFVFVCVFLSVFVFSRHSIRSRRVHKIFELEGRIWCVCLIYFVFFVSFLLGKKVHATKAIHMVSVKRYGFAGEKKKQNK